MIQGQQATIQTPTSQGSQTLKEVKAIEFFENHRKVIIEI